MASVEHNPPDNWDNLKKQFLHDPNTVYASDNNRSHRWHMGDPSGTNYLISHCSYLAYRHHAQYSGRNKPPPPPAARFAVIGDLTVRHFDFLPDSNWSPIPAAGRTSTFGRATAILQDPQPENKQSDFKKAWAQLVALAACPLPPTYAISQSQSFFSVHRGVPSFILSHCFLQVRQPSMTLMFTTQSPSESRLTCS